jgi:hypothetical protein
MDFRKGGIRTSAQRPTGGGAAATAGQKTVSHPHRVKPLRSGGQQATGSCCSLGSGLSEEDNPALPPTTGVPQ